MPLRLKIKKELTARSDRVKSVDIFPAENPWVLAALYSGNIFIWDYSNNTMIKSFETGNNPVRCAKFIVRKQWIVAGTDDMKLRVFNYNTMDKVKEWEAHTDYIRFIEVHPNRPYILSSSDDMSIKLWDWERNFDLLQIFEGHAHYVMMAKINPRDTNTFATASLDKTIKVWGLTAGTAHFSLEGHEKGVNCVDYYPGGDKPYLLSGADDRTVKIWDYQTKACLQTLEGHSHNVSSVCFHPRLPVILSSSEDGTVRLWHSTTYRPETTLNYGLDRAWAVAVARDSNKIAIGYDEGLIVLKLGNERPVASLDVNSAKLVLAQSHDIQTAALKGIARMGDKELADGERISLPTRDLGACEVYPQALTHNCNGSFVCICGDGEYIIYTSQALRNKAFGSALDFTWSALGSGDYAIRESISRIKIFKNFKEHPKTPTLSSLPIASAEGIFGGHCLAVKGSDCVLFFDWEEGTLLRKIDVVPLAIYWSEAGDRVTIACADVFYVLHFNREVVDQALSAGSVSAEEGVAGAFELLFTVNERVHTGQWVGECFLYTNGNRKLQYLVNGQSLTVCHLTQAMYLLGYVAKEDRVFLIDKQYNVTSHKLLLSVLSYQTAVVRRDFVSANALLPHIPASEHAHIARFLEAQGFKEEALAVSNDKEQRFDLAIELKKLQIAESVLRELAAEREREEGVAAARESLDLQGKWRKLGDLALSHANLSLAEVCAVQSADLSGLLLLYSAQGEREKLLQLARQARERGRLNVSFVAYLLCQRVEDILDLLIEHNRLSEAAFFCRTYYPSQIPRVLDLWQKDLGRVSERAAQALASPTQYPNLFPDYAVALEVEKMFFAHRDTPVPASQYLQAKEQLSLDLIATFKPQLAARMQRDQELAQRETETVRETDSESEKEKEREKERARQEEEERQREIERERERAREKEREEEEERQRQRERELVAQRERERALAKEQERQRELERQREIEREKELERQREIEREKERERERQRREEEERQRERERQQREEELQRQRERERLAELERERERERERQRVEEEAQRERERQRELERARELLAEQERERERLARLSLSSPSPQSASPAPSPVKAAPGPALQSPPHSPPQSPLRASAAFTAPSAPHSPLPAATPTQRASSAPVTHADEDEDDLSLSDGEGEREGGKDLLEQDDDMSDFEEDW